MASELPAVLNVVQLFDGYNDVDQVKNLTDRVQRLKENLTLQLANDLKQNFKVISN